MNVSMEERRMSNVRNACTAAEQVCASRNLGAGTKKRELAVDQEWMQRSRQPLALGKRGTLAWSSALHGEGHSGFCLDTIDDQSPCEAELHVGSRCIACPVSKNLMGI